MKRHEVRLTADAERDLEDTYLYVARADSIRSADAVLERLLEPTDELSTVPSRGALPRELEAVGVREYRQVLFKPYRVIYRVHGRRVVIYLIADGRRDLQGLLAQRLLRS